MPCLQVLVDAAPAEGVPALGDDCVLLLLKAHLHSNAARPSVLLPAGTSSAQIPGNADPRQCQQQVETMPLCSRTATNW